MWLNYFPIKGGVSKEIITHTIIGGKTYNTHSISTNSLSFMSKTNEYNKSLNITKERNLGAIFLGTTGNTLLTYIFESLRTRKIVTITHWTLL